MVTLAAAVAQVAIGVLSFCVRDKFKCCATTAAPADPAVKPSDDDDDDEADGMKNVHLNVTLSCCGARATVENEAILRQKSHTPLPPETSV